MESKWPMLWHCSIVMVPSTNLKVGNRKVGKLIVHIAVVMQGDNCLVLSLSRPHLSLNEWLNKVHQGPAGSGNRIWGLKPFKNLRLEELREECHARGLPTEENKKDLGEIFEKEMGGIQRVPVIMFFDQEKNTRLSQFMYDKTSYCTGCLFQIKLVHYKLIFLKLKHILSRYQYWTVFTTLSQFTCVNVKNSVSMIFWQ